MSGWGSRWDGPPDSYYDPPDDPPLVTCPTCGGEGDALVSEAEGPGGETIEHRETCPRCKGDGEDYLTDEEVRDARAEAEIDRAEARRDGHL